jgi:hypothetical protein
VKILVRSTSRGLIGLRFWNLPTTGGVSVSVGTADDQGWVDEDTRWHSRQKDESLADAIVEAASLPRDEAEQLATSALQEWRDRGGEEEGRGDTLKGLGLVTAVGGGVLVLLATLVTLIWLAFQIL